MNYKTQTIFRQSEILINTFYTIVLEKNIVVKTIKKYEKSVPMYMKLHRFSLRFSLDFNSQCL